jgi:hypothetical protein
MNISWQAYLMEGSSKVIRRNNRKYLGLGASLLCSMHDVCICLWIKVYGINNGSNLAPTPVRGLLPCSLHTTWNLLVYLTSSQANCHYRHSTTTTVWLYYFIVSKQYLSSTQWCIITCSVPAKRHILPHYQNAPSLLYISQLKLCPPLLKNSLVWQVRPNDIFSSSTREGPA